MTVQVYKNDDGTYEWVEGTFTQEDFEVAIASSDVIKWIEENTEVVPRPRQ